MDKTKIITELLGRQFKVSPNWDLSPLANRDLPGWEPCFTRDINTLQTFMLYESPDHKDYKMQIYNPAYKCYVQYDLVFIGYHREHDMRYQYEKRKTHKV